MTELFLSFAGISLSTGLMVAVWMLPARLLHRRFAAKWNYMVWIFLAVRLLVPVGGAAGQSVPELSFLENLRTETKQPESTADTRADGTGLRGRIMVELPAEMTAPITVQSETAAAGVTLPGLVVLIWMAGCLVFLSAHLVSLFCYQRRVKEKGRQMKDARVLSCLRGLKRELHIRQAVQVVEYGEAGSPMLIGFLKPVLILPEKPCDKQELYFILKHEMVHLKRRDVWVKLIFVTANAVHWFNPLVWILRKEAAVDMELSCDERVMRGEDRATRRAYTETLLAMLQRRCVSRSDLTTQFYGGKEIMKRRFKNILQKREQKNGAVILIAAVCLTVCLGTLIGCSVTEKSGGTPAGEPADLSAGGTESQAVGDAAGDSQTGVGSEGGNRTAGGTEGSSRAAGGSEGNSRAEGGSEGNSRAAGGSEGNSRAAGGTEGSSRTGGGSEEEAAGQNASAGQADAAGAPGEEDQQEIRSAVEEFAAAYFDGDAGRMREFLADTYEGEPEVYETDGTISDLTVKGISADDGPDSDGERCVASLEFRDSTYEDMFLYVTFVFVRQDDGWKIEFYGVEG